MGSRRSTRRGGASLNKLASKVAGVTCWLFLGSGSVLHGVTATSDIHVARGYSPAELQPRATTADLSSGNSSTPSSASPLSPANLARYGHSSIYFPTSSSVLFLGGQQSPTSALAAPLRLSLASPFSSDAESFPLLPISYPDLPSSAWSASATDSSGRGWLLGGLSPSPAADCSTSPLAHVLPTLESSWSIPALHPRAPPRRRQAALASLPSGELYLLGGIADKLTCSLSTAAYRGVDRINTITGDVETFGWEAPKEAEAAWEPPVSDAQAEVLEDGKTVLLMGGQGASGKLASMKEVLLFDTVKRTWSLEPAKGSIPSPRMGHVLIPLSSDQFLLHGGLGASQQPFSELHLLTRTPSTSPSSPSTASTAAKWEWMTLPISPSSLPAPARAWHTATLTEQGTVVVGFGMDTLTGDASGEIWFLEVEEDGSYAWSRDWSPEEQTIAMLGEPKEGLELQKRVVRNPKWTTSQAATSWTEQATTTMGEDSWTEPTSTEAPAYTPPAVAWSSSSARPLSTSFIAPSPTSLASSTTASNSDNSASDSDTPKTTTIAATVGSLVALVALLGLGGIALRRHQARKGIAAQLEVAETPTPGFVSTLMYTRPLNKRMLSLGSTVSTRAPSEVGSEGVDEMKEVPLGGVGGVQDPFADPHPQVTVSELGQLQSRTSPSLLSPSSPSTPPTGRLAALSPSIASVASIPYLAALVRTTSNDSASATEHSQSAYSQSDDHFTAVTPTLGSRRSLRRLREDNTPLPPTQERFDAPAPSGLEGRRGSWLDFVKVGRSSSQGHGSVEGSKVDEMRQVRSGATTPVSVAATVGGASRMNSRASGQSHRSGGGISRPHTPLRVVNADVEEVDEEDEDPSRDQQ